MAGTKFEANKPSLNEWNFLIFLLFYNDLGLNNQKILCLPSIFQFERKLGFWTTLVHLIYKMFLISAGLKNEMLKIPQIPLVSLSFLSIFCHQIKMYGQMVCNFCHELSCGFHARLWTYYHCTFRDRFFLPSILDRGCGVLNTRMCIDIIV